MTRLSLPSMLKVLQRGTAGHLSYQAAMAGWSAQSELALYPAIASLLQARGWEPWCQWKLPGSKLLAGAPRTIDFVARPSSSETKHRQPWDLAMEVKWLKIRGTSRRLDVENDVGKLNEFKQVGQGGHAYILIVGRKQDIYGTHVYIGNKRIDLQACSPIIADLGQTAWGSVLIPV